jgi:hypothetical protein
LSVLFNDCGIALERNRRATPIDFDALTEVNVEGAGMVFALIAFVFSISALEKIRRLEKQLKEAGVLKEGPD